MSHRIEQINELVRHEVSQLMLTELELPQGCLVTITRVITSKDLRHAKILISVMPEKFMGTVLEIIRKNIGQIQHQLNQRLSMKPLPRLNFAIDSTEQEAAKIEELLDRIKKTG